VPPQGGRKHPQQEFLEVDTTNRSLSELKRTCTSLGLDHLSRE